MSNAEYSQKWRDTHPGAQYKSNKKWRHTNPDKRHSSKKRNYNKTSYAPNHRKPWTQAEDQQVLEHTIPDIELATKIGRSVQAIQIRRSRLSPPEPPSTP